jgi:outer membrane protein assembly factor BamB
LISPILSNTNNQMYRLFITILTISLITACSIEEKLTDGVIWRSALNQKSLIYDVGLGYPTYKNNVVYHSTPVPWGTQESILHGLDTETGKEKWRLSNNDFHPKKDLRFNSFAYGYQRENVVIGCDSKGGIPTPECYAYAIDIESGKVLWVKPILTDYLQVGYSVKGMGKYAYIDAFTDDIFSLLKVDIESGEISVPFKVAITDFPDEIKNQNPVFFNCYLAPIYKNSKGDDIVACSLMSRNLTRPNDLLVVLYVYNLTQNSKVYSTTITLKDGCNARINYHDGKILIGKYHTVYCYDAFENKKYWEKSIILNDGIGRGSGNDEIMQVMSFNNLALVYCVDKLVCFDLNTGLLKYNVSANDNTASIIDGIIYQREGSDLGMRDPNTGSLLKRIATGRDEQSFSSARPNGADGKIFVHTYTHAYCIKAWGK